MGRAVVLGMVGLALSAASADAQVAVQQPVVGVQTVRTAVSVPDGGSALLGGVNRARMGAKSFGPGLFPAPGSSYGREVSGSSSRVTVTIHDFEEMDRLLLAMPTRRSVETHRFRNPQAAAAWKQLSARGR